ncbi:hypothetical protein TREMEDRAFT_59886 [Tremella mesenterica DSM 1558]|uniref:uncharacterized protein n=1 Tax=Tremella mesenterica (strain ATCC 24925 / CBS 8224 / DSM 1558 / NBRC 9311 / NRRL Y-6157 / RJB 2259-6 / UBC 559-6) TaxID=578456 RepID=UPI0003F48EBF|nr:uncharacterized protein TREMEDRAFT_59886 [Tremella mesenterica DSM 1558]EIW73713.1 hypothetical protein TREMEDRAFT_59886 [Tremella mesenterica DSM 1558]
MTASPRSTSNSTNEYYSLSTGSSRPVSPVRSSPDDHSKSWESDVTLVDNVFTVPNGGVESNVPLPARTIMNHHSTEEPSSTIGWPAAKKYSPAASSAVDTQCQRSTMFGGRADTQVGARESNSPQSNSMRTQSIKTGQRWGVRKLFPSIFGTRAKPAEELEELVSEKTVEQQPEGISGFEVQAVVSQLAIAEMIVLLAAEKEKTAHWKAEAQMSLPAHVIRDLSEFRDGICSWIGSTVDPIRTRLGMSSMYPAPSAMEDGSEIIDKWLLQKVHQIQMSTANELMSGY